MGKSIPTTDKTTCDNSKGASEEIALDPSELKPNCDLDRFTPEIV